MDARDKDWLTGKREELIQQYLKEELDNIKREAEVAERIRQEKEADLDSLQKQLTLKEELLLKRESQAIKQEE